VNKPLTLKIFITVIVFAIGCAKQMPPRGGPIDKTPPTVINIVPEPGSTNVETNQPIEITFSKRMVKKSVEDAIFFAPLPSENIFYRWRGKKLKIEFPDTYKLNRTYVLTIGAQSSDIRNNRMLDSFSMAFSTGAQIDSGQISGTVYSRSKVEGTLVCAFLLDNNGSDPDPSQKLADYFTQCNQQGKYDLMYIAPGKYRLFAINDRDGDRRYSRGIDGIGLTTRDVLLTPDSMVTRNINFQTTIEDTTLLYVKSVYAVDQQKVDVRFNEPVRPIDAEVPDHYFKITEETVPNHSLAITSCYQNSKDGSVFHLLTETQSPVSYQLEAMNLFDLSGNGIDTAYSAALFSGSTLPDSIGPVVIYQSIVDSSTGIQPDTSIKFIFSEPIYQPSFERGMVVVEHKSGAQIAAEFLWRNPDQVIFDPIFPLKFSTEYLITVQPDSVKDVSGNSLQDSVLSIYFKTLSADTLSAISGNLIDRDQSASGKIILKASSEQHRYISTLEKPGAYLFDNIFPGIYTIYAFRDADNNGIYSYGQVKPFQPAERFVFYPDSIKVRSNWPNEGNDIILEK